MFEESEDFDDYCEAMREAEAEAQKEEEAAEAAQERRTSTEDMDEARDDLNEDQVFKVPEVPAQVEQKPLTEMEKKERTSRWVEEGLQAEQELREHEEAIANFNAACDADDGVVRPER